MDDQSAQRGVAYRCLDLIGLSRKIWQKIKITRGLAAEAARG